MAGEGAVFKFPFKIKKFVLIFLLLLISDVVIAFLGSFFLSDRISFFYNKSATHVLCDLLFLEGAMIFLVGVFLSVRISGLFTDSSSRPFSTPKRSGEDVAESRQGQYSVGMLLMIAGASLVGLSVAIGTLLL